MIHENEICTSKLNKYKINKYNCDEFARPGDKARNRMKYMASCKIVSGLLNSDNFVLEFTFKDNDFSSLR